MSLTERIGATLRPLFSALPLPMSLLSARAVRIYLAPRHVVAAAVQGDRIAGMAALAVANPDGQWQAPLAQLRALLERPADTLAAQLRQPGGADADAVVAALAAPAPVSVSLSGHWCQCVMAPWSDAMLAEPAATRFLQMQLSAVYGDAARGWSIAGEDAPYGQPRAVCGIDAELLRALRTDLGKRCGAIEPLIGTVSRMRTGMAAFAIVETGKLTMATLARGRIAALCSQPCGHAWQGELERAWQRWALRMPELDGIANVAVIDLAGQPSGPHVLAPLFRPAGTPFGQAALTAMEAEALCA